MAEQMTASRGVLVADIGFSRRGAVARILDAAGLLDRYVVGFASPQATQAHRWNLSPARRHVAIPARRLTTFRLLGTIHAATRLVPRSFTWRSTALGSAFSSRAANKIGLTTGAVYSIPYSALELFRAARTAGLPCILEQNQAPIHHESTICSQERQEWPEWEPRPERDLESHRLIDRQTRERDLATDIICPSEHIAELIRGQARSHTVPYGLDVDRYKVPRRPLHKGPLRLLYVGQVRLQKGVQYLAQAARALPGLATFTLCGPVKVSKAATAALAAIPNIHLKGPIQHSAIGGELWNADAFIFPSLCEGSSLACIEAMASGLPVICTPTAGTTLTIDGPHGPGACLAPGCAESIVAAVHKLLACNLDDLRQMGHNSRAHAKAHHSLDAAGKRLALTIRSILCCE